MPTIAMGGKSRNSELGRALSRRRLTEQRNARLQAGNDGDEARHWENAPPGNLQSILDTSDLQEVMERASLANSLFNSAQLSEPVPRQTIVLASGATGADTTTAKRRGLDLNSSELRIPRRPHWNSSTTTEELEENENASFTVWRRNIADIENSLAKELGWEGTQLTPFEKNIHVWRQLWRVVERSDVVVQIVDARNPLLYYCSDLYRYVSKEMRRGHILLVNKADLLTSRMLALWEKYFNEQGIDVVFFSAFQACSDEKSHDSRVKNVAELIEKLHCFPRILPITRPNQRVTVGMVGYPNVGKSSTINILLESMATRTSRNDEHANNQTQSNCDEEETEHIPKSVDLPADVNSVETTSEVAEKRVAVSSTPGKTKHFQTLVLSERVLLCDCPGLVFPNFSASKAELICAGVLSVDQMRGNPLGPMSLVARRIPSWIFEGVYGIRFARADADFPVSSGSGSRRFADATTLLETHARARGFMSDHDKPDVSRSARVLLKDYISGRISFSHAPPPRDEKDGEAGIGPEVVAKKGKLMRAREDAVITVSPDDVLPDDRPRERSSSLHKVREITELGYNSSNASSEPVARISRGKKHVPEVFRRVERNFYPKW